MRAMNLTIDAPNQSASVRALKALRAIDPNIEIGPTLARLRGNEEVLSIETDCPEWKQRATAVLDLLTQLDTHDIAHAI